MHFSLSDFPSGDLTHSGTVQDVPGILLSCWIVTYVDDSKDYFATLWRLLPSPKSQGQGWGIVTGWGPPSLMPDLPKEMTLFV